MYYTSSVTYGDSFPLAGVADNAKALSLPSRGRLCSILGITAVMVVPTPSVLEIDKPYSSP